MGKWINQRCGVNLAKVTTTRFLLKCPGRDELLANRPVAGKTGVAGCRRGVDAGRVARAWRVAVFQGRG